MHKLLALLAVSALTIVACSESAAEGTLQAIVDEEGETVGFGSFSQGTDKSFGIFICSEGRAEIESVEAVSTEGNVEFLGALVYTSDDQFVGAAHGWPADGLDEEKLEPADGAVVEIGCDSPEGAERVQLVVGTERTGAGGGVVDGIRVKTAGGDLEIPFTILLCGDNLEYCDVLLPEDT